MARFLSVAGIIGVNALAGEHVTYETGPVYWGEP